MQWKHLSRVILKVFRNIRKSRNIWGGDYYRTWTLKLTVPALAHAHAQFKSFTVHLR